MNLAAAARLGDRVCAEEVYAPVMRLATPASQCCFVPEANTDRLESLFNICGEER
jgi:hypothetical protein